MDRLFIYVVVEPENLDGLLKLLVVAPETVDRFFICMYACYQTLNRQGVGAECCEWCLRDAIHAMARRGVSEVVAFVERRDAGGLAKALEQSAVNGA